MKSLRQKALELLENKNITNKNSIDIKEIIHELNVNQIELEIQNEELREKEQELLVAQEELTQLFMDAPIAYLVLDKDYYLRKYNKYAFDIFKFSQRKEKIYFFTFLEKMNTMNSFINWTSKNDEEFFEIAIKTTCGILKWIRLTHKITKLNNENMHLLSVSDITNEKEKKEKLYMYDSILEKLPVNIMIANKEGYITYVNQQVVNTSGYLKDELIGLRPSIFRSEFTSEEEYLKLWKTISNGKTWTGLLKNKTKFKEINWMATAISPILDEKGDIASYISVETNIDEKIRMQDKLKKQEDIMLVQARHAAMGEMISIIAHQWRQPLSVISTLATGIKMQKELNLMSQEDEIENLEAINESAQYLSETIEDFKNFFKNNKTLEDTNPKKIIEKVEKLNSELLKSNGIEFIVDISSDDNISTYENELLQVLINLINNSKDALLEKQELIEKPMISIKIYNSNKNLTFEINDNAQGIPENIIKKIFDPYFTTKGPTSGTGLGLYITKTIIDKHLKGTISVKNNENGALFVINIPNFSKD